MLKQCVNAWINNNMPRFQHSPWIKKVLWHKKKLFLFSEMLRISLFSQDMLNVCNCSLQCFRQSSKSIACRLDMKPCKAKECLAQTSQGWWPNNGDTMVDLSHHPRAHHISKFPNALRNNFPQSGHFHIAVHEKGETGTSQVQTNFITTFICPHCVL